MGKILLYLYWCNNTPITQNKQKKEHKMTDPINPINREQFEAWLYAQPDSRPYNYMEGRPDSKIGCVLCNYIREATNIKDFIVGGTWLTANGIFNQMPQWLQQVINDGTVQCGHTFKYAKARYTALFDHNTPKVEPLSQPLTEVLV